VGVTFPAVTRPPACHATRFHLHQSHYVTYCTDSSSSGGGGGGKSRQWSRVLLDSLRTFLPERQN